jgi:hypothetical protein
MTFEALLQMNKKLQGSFTWDDVVKNIEKKTKEKPPVLSPEEVKKLMDAGVTVFNIQPKER